MPVNKRIPFRTNPIKVRMIVELFVRKYKEENTVETNSHLLTLFSSFAAGDPRPVRGDVLPCGVHPAVVDAVGHRPQPPPRLRQQLGKLPHLHARGREVQVGT